MQKTLFKPLQKSRADLLGKNLWAEFPDLAGTIVEKNFHRAMELQQTIEFDLFYPPLSSWIHLRCCPYQDGLSIYFQDVTELKQNEALLAAEKKTLGQIAKEYRFPVF